MRTLVVLSMVGCFIAAGASVEAKPWGTPLPGYQCMMLNITEQQSMDTSFHVWAQAAPSAKAPRVGWVGAVVPVRSPEHTVNGFAEGLFPTGRTVWISANMLRPYKNASDPNARCAIERRPDGRIGTYDPAKGP